MPTHNICLINKHTQISNLIAVLHCDTYASSFAILTKNNAAHIHVAITIYAMFVTKKQFNKYLQTNNSAWTTDVIVYSRQPITKVLQYAVSQSRHRRLLTLPRSLWWENTSRKTPWSGEFRGSLPPRRRLKKQRVHFNKLDSLHIKLSSAAQDK